jgi:hypothetical protein
MSGALSLLAVSGASGSGGGSTISFTAANSTNGAYFYYGWSSYSNGAIGQRPYIPGTTMGSVSGSPTLGGYTLQGIYSNSTSIYSIATRYVVLFNGSPGSGLVSSLTINGTPVGTTPTGFATDGSSTYYYYDVSASATLVTASSTAVIT